MDVPYGYCHCGCGEKTKFNTQSDPRRGFVKGEPRRYVNGHTLRNYHQTGDESPTWKGGARKDKDGYILLLKKDHHRADSHGYVREHIYVAEQALGRTLPNGYVIHHRNGIKSDNSLHNLILCPSQRYHNFLHAQDRALEQCGHSNWRPCRLCHKYDSPDKMVNLKSKGRVNHFYHASCHAAYERARRAKIKLQDNQ